VCRSDPGTLPLIRLYFRELRRIHRLSVFDPPLGTSARCFNAFGPRHKWLSNRFSVRFHLYLGADHVY
jgi:hypothetical protein